ncbi:MAG: hypothetical protein FWC64_07940, partial [Treponema sp.]|nr:hypothetical protein [Treponema sp.]
MKELLEMGRRFFFKADSAGCEGVQSVVVEIRVAINVIPITSRYTQQGSGWPSGEEWQNVNLPHTNLRMSRVGCTVALMANIAYTHGRMDVTPASIIANTGDFVSDRAIAALGSIKWGNVAGRIGLSRAVDRVRGRILTIDEYNRLNRGSI